MELLIRAAEDALRIVEGVLLAAKVALKGVQVVVDKAQSILNVRFATLRSLRWTLRTGLKALEYITSFPLAGIIDIQEIGFDLPIDLFKHGYISAYMDVSFLRQSPVRLGIRLPIFRPVALVGDLAERVVPGVTGRRKREIGGKVNILW